MSRPCAIRRAPLVRLALAGGVAASGIAGLAAVAQTAPTVPGGPNKVQFPADWAKGVLYATVDRHDTLQYREMYTSADAVKAAREGRPVPDGTVITLAAYAAKVDADKKPVVDANGRFVKDRLVSLTVMEKRKGFGDEIPAAIRNGDWQYQAFTPDGKVNEKANLTACYQCHLPFAKDDYLTNLAKLQGRFPTVASVATRASPNDVAIRGFTFGPAAVRVTVGQPVTWTNADDTPHQITLVGKPQRSDVMLKGQTAKLQFDEAGNIAYICGLHPTMKGSVEVVARQ